MTKTQVNKIFKNISFTEKEINFICDSFEKIIVKKGDLLLKPNLKANYQYYVESGCLRSFFINSQGKDHTTQFAIKDWWISDYISFFTESETVMSIECLQEAVIFKLSKENMEKLCTVIPEIETFFRNKLQRAFASFQKRILDYLSLSAKERYINFIEDYVTILPFIKNYHIASYLGITTESLSRIRKMKL